MDTTVGCAPEPGPLIPPFSLRSIEGEIVSPWDFKERHNILLVFFDHRKYSDLEMVSLIGRRHKEFQDQNTVVLGISSGSQDEFAQCLADLHLPFKLLNDESGEVGCSYGVTGPTLFAVDRFGAVLMSREGKGDLETHIDYLIDQLALAELECPECGVPTWTL